MLRRSLLGMLALLGARPAVAGDTDGQALWRRPRGAGVAGALEPVVPRYGGAAPRAG